MSDRTRPPAEEREIDALEHGIAELRGPCAPLFGWSAVQQLGTAPLSWMWQRDILADFICCGKIKAAKAPKARRIWA